MHRAFGLSLIYSWSGFCKRLYNITLQMFLTKLPKTRPHNCLAGYFIDIFLEVSECRYV